MHSSYPETTPDEEDVIPSHPAEIEGPIRTTMSYEEFCSVAMDLEIHHSIFSKFWDVSRPVFITGIGTAYVAFDKNARMLEFAIDPVYWESLNEQNKLFLVAHECLHITLNHGVRAKDLPSSMRQVANVAMDIVVNHMLINSFGFSRLSLNQGDSYCWTDTVFKDEIIEDNLGFETYYNMLLERMDLDSVNISKSLVDSHEKLGSFSGSGDGAEEDSDDGIDSLSSDDWKDLTDKVSDDASVEDLKDFMEKLGKEAGSADNKAGKMMGGKGVVGEPKLPGELMSIIKFKSIVYKSKWESVIKKWTAYSVADNDEYQWVVDDRRFATMKDEGLIFPQLATVESKNFEKINIMFFLDTSGSCIHLKDRFFNAALSLNPKKFNVRMFSRTTVVHEVDIKKLENVTFYGGGSDDFGCIERYIQADIKSGKLKKYPDAVFHITDGHDCSGYKVKPQKPENWYWFLTEYSTEAWIPEKSKIYKLADFE